MKRNEVIALGLLIVAAAMLVVVTWRGVVPTNFAAVLGEFVIPGVVLGLTAVALIYWILTPTPVAGTSEKKRTFVLFVMVLFGALITGSRLAMLASVLLLLSIYTPKPWKPGAVRRVVLLTIPSAAILLVLLYVTRDIWK